MLSKIREDEGKVNEAADILQELQVETFGSMDKREKTDFILEQMRLTLAKRDYTRTQIISRKINTKFFSDAEQHVCTCYGMFNILFFFAMLKNICPESSLIGS
jgi:hypothetical protein